MIHEILKVLYSVHVLVMSRDPVWNFRFSTVPFKQLACLSINQVSIICRSNFKRHLLKERKAQGVWNIKEIEMTQPALPCDYLCFADRTPFEKEIFV